MYYIISRKEPRCIYCEAAKNLADKAGLEYEIVPVEDVTEFMEQNGIKTVPAIFNPSISMENFIGGHTEFQRHIYSS
jgi:glutaredoxin